MNETVSFDIEHDIRNSILGRLVPLGLPPHVAQSAQQSVQALVTGWTTLRSKPGADPAEEPFRESLDVLISG